MTPRPPTPSRTSRKRTALKLDGYLPFRLAVASAWVSKLISKTYEQKFGLTIPQWRVIAILGDEGPMSQQQMAQRSIMDKIATHRAASALKEKGILSTTDAQDRRFKILELTNYGRKVFEDVAPLALELEKELLKLARVSDIRNLERDLLELEAAARHLYEEMEQPGESTSDENKAD